MKRMKYQQDQGYIGDGLSGEVWERSTDDPRQGGFEEEPLGYQQYGHPPYSRTYRIFSRDYDEYREKINPLEEDDIYVPPVRGKGRKPA